MWRVCRLQCSWWSSWREGGSSVCWEGKFTTAPEHLLVNVPEHNFPACLSAHETANVPAHGPEHVPAHLFALLIEHVPSNVTKFLPEHVAENVPSPACQQSTAHAASTILTPAKVTTARLPAHTHVLVIAVVLVHVYKCKYWSIFICIY